MATVYQRLQENITNRPKGFMIGKDHRSKLGHIVSNHFKTTHPGVYYDLIESNEYGETYNVNNYPEDFNPEIDQLIKNYYSALLAEHKARKANQGEQSAPRKQRARIPVKKPRYSAAPDK